MGVALPWKWFTWLFGLSESRAQAISYLSSPLFALVAVWMIHFLCNGQVISDSLIDFFDVDSRSKALGDRLPSFE